VIRVERGMVLAPSILIEKSGKGKMEPSVPISDETAPAQNLV
jgi:hypothetical protein